MSQPEFPQSLCFFWFFGLFGLRLLRAYSWKKHFPLPAFDIQLFTISLRKRLFPKYFRHFILNFFLWRPDFSKGSSLLSLKTGLFQREVASREESSIWTNRLCVCVCFGEPGVFCLPFFSRKTSWSWNNQVPRLTSKNRMVRSRKFPADSCYKSNTSLKQTAQQQLWEEEPKPVAAANLLFALKGWVIQTDFVHRGKTVWKKTPETSQ